MVTHTQVLSQANLVPVSPVSTRRYRYTYESEACAHAKQLRGVEAPEGQEQSTGGAHLVVRQYVTVLPPHVADLFQQPIALLAAADNNGIRVWRLHALAQLEKGETYKCPARSY